MRDDEAVALVFGLLILAGMSTTNEIDRRKWVWPIPRAADGRRPSISQEFRRGLPPHLGVDLMYRSPSGGWDVPEGTRVMAAGDGEVTTVQHTARGWGVVVRHSPTLWTYYQHLSSVAVAVGQRVNAGGALGVVGRDPTDPQGLPHLHFAVWRGQWGDAGSEDPARRMWSWGVRDA